MKFCVKCGKYYLNNKESDICPFCGHERDFSIEKIDPKTLLPLLVYVFIGLIIGGLVIGIITLFKHLIVTLVL